MVKVPKRGPRGTLDPKGGSFPENYFPDGSDVGGVKALSNIFRRQLKSLKGTLAVFVSSTGIPFYSLSGVPVDGWVRDDRVPVLLLGLLVPVLLPRQDLVVVGFLSSPLLCRTESRPGVHHSLVILCLGGAASRESTLRRALVQIQQRSATHDGELLERVVGRAGGRGRNYPLTS